MNVKNEIGDQSTTLGDRIRDLRVNKIGADQKSFARLLGVSQAIVSQWENNKYEPSAMALMAMGNYAGEAKAWWYGRAGTEYATVEEAVTNFRQTFRVNDDDNGTVLIYGSVGAGPFRCDPRDAEERISVPRSWFSASAQMIGLVARGDSMLPLIGTGYVLLVDRSQTEWARLVDKIVAVGDGDGLSVKWLRKLGKAYVLVPENQTEENRIIPVARNHRILGRVMRWVAIAPGGNA